MTERFDRPVTAPDALAFADKRIDGAYPVTAPDGSVVVRIWVSRWSGSTFEAVTGYGAPLCSGRHRGWLSRSWDAYDPVGAVLVSVRSSFWGNSKSVLLPAGRELRIAGKMLSRDWVLTDPAGRTVLGADAQGSSLSFHPDAFVVRCYDDSLGLAQIISIVELNRLMVKAARGSAAAANSS